jgi:hypothetical protein
MDFKTYYLKLVPEEREKFAKKIGSSTGYCQQIAYGTKRLELGLADAIVAAAQPDITLADLPLTERAKFQNQARQWDGKERRATPPCSASKGR